MCILSQMEDICYKNFKIDNILGVFSFWFRFYVSRVHTTFDIAALELMASLSAILARANYVCAHTNLNEHCTILSIRVSEDELESCPTSIPAALYKLCIPLFSLKISLLPYVIFRANWE